MANPDLTAALTSLKDEIEALNTRLEAVESASGGLVVEVVEYLSEITSPTLGQLVITTKEPLQPNPPRTLLPILWCYSHAYSEYNDDPNNVYPDTPQYSPAYPAEWRKVRLLYNNSPGD